jgi:hypothetical protein
MNKIDEKEIEKAILKKYNGDVAMLAKYRKLLGFFKEREYVLSLLHNKNE